MLQRYKRFHQNWWLSDDMSYQETKIMEHNLVMTNENMLGNKKREPIVIEWFTPGWKLKVLLVFITKC